MKPVALSGRDKVPRIERLRQRLRTGVPQPRARTYA
jgi:hypothetical protein